MTTFKSNPYHILGIDTFASQKDLLKRSKEIINRLKIDDYPEYDFDLDIFSDFRTEELVKDSMQKLQNPKKKIKEYFFWFQIADATDEKALDCLKKNDFDGAIQIWSEASNGTTGKALFYKKNLAVLFCLLLSAEKKKTQFDKATQKYFFEDSLSLWHEIVTSDKFWNAFSKVYKLHDEQTVSQELIDKFTENVENYLSDIYTELHDIHKDGRYISEFQKTFSKKGKKIEKTILNPAYQAINAAVEQLESMNVSADGVLDKDETDSIKKAIKVIQAELNNLADLELFEDSQTKIMRDKAANAIRSIVLDIHNNLNEYEKSLQLLKAAIQITGTESLKGKLKNELDQIQKNIDGEADSAITINIHGLFSVGTAIFNKRCVEYDEKKLLYKDITEISYLATSHSVNFVPTGKSWDFYLGTDSQNISLSFGTSLFGKKTEEGTFEKLIYVAKNLIEPVIVEKLMRRIFEKEETINIGGIELNKDGYCRSKFFGGKEWVYWTDTVYVPVYNAGQVALFKDKDGKGVSFSSIPMSTTNAVVLPELVKACANYILSN